MNLIFKDYGPTNVKFIWIFLLQWFQRENIELYLKGCESFGLKAQDLFQVNDLYESKNLYMIVDNLYCLGGMVTYMLEKYFWTYLTQWF